MYNDVDNDLPPFYYSIDGEETFLFANTKAPSNGPPFLHVDEDEHLRHQHNVVASTSTHLPVDVDELLLNSNFLEQPNCDQTEDPLFWNCKVINDEHLDEFLLAEENPPAQSIQPSQKLVTETKPKLNVPSNTVTSSKDSTVKPKPKEKQARLDCPYCKRSFSKNFDLQQHMRCHTGEKPFQCIVCGRGFAQKSNVKKHMQAHKVWPEGPNNPGPPTNHGNSRSRNNSASSSLGTPRDDERMQEDETQINGNNISNNGITLGLSSDRRNDGNDIFAENRYSCSYCQFNGRTYFELKSHLTIHKREKVFKCIVSSCGKTFSGSDLQGFLDHVTGHKDLIYNCHLCSGRFYSLGEFGEHQKNHSNVQVKRTSLGQSSQPQQHQHQQQPSQQHQLQPPQQQQPSSQPPQPQQPPAQQQQPLQQQQQQQPPASQQQAHQSNVQQHHHHHNHHNHRYQQQHAHQYQAPQPVQPVQPPQQLQQAQQQLQTQSQQQQPTLVPVTNQYNSASLRQHNQQVTSTQLQPQQNQRLYNQQQHQGSQLSNSKTSRPFNSQPPKNNQKFFRCPKCMNRYTTQTALDHHLSISTHNYPCTECNKVFMCERYLRRHLNTHTAVQHVCSSCDKQFKTAAYLKMHSVVHTGEKPFRCNLCEAAFNRRDKLSRHKLTHETVKKFKCPFRPHIGCTKEFNRPDKLKAHVLTHSGVRPHPCDACDRTFSRLSRLREHKKLHHDNNNNTIESKPTVANPQVKQEMQCLAD